MNVLLIDNETKRLKQIQEMLSSFKVDIIGIEYIKTDVNKYDFVVLSGGGIDTAFSRKKIVQAEVDLIKNAKVPIFGICLGMQLIVRSFSPVTYKKLVPRRCRVMEIKYKNKKLNVFNSHTWSVPNVSLPLIKLSESVDGVEILKHNKKLIWGVQFHPEADAEFGTNGKLIFDEFLTKIQPQ